MKYALEKRRIQKQQQAVEEVEEVDEAEEQARYDQLMAELDDEEDRSGKRQKNKKNAGNVFVGAVKGRKTPVSASSRKNDNDDEDVQTTSSPTKRSTTTTANTIVKKSPKSSSVFPTYLIILLVLFLFGAFGYLKLQSERVEQLGGLSSHSNIDFYSALDLSSSASQSEIRRSYRRLSVRYHPDKNPGCVPCAERFTAINQAYETLSDPTRRKTYDTTKGQVADAILSDHSKLISGESELLAILGGTASPANNLPWAIQIYADGDGVSRKFAPVWDRVADQFNEEINFARIEAVRFPQLAAMLPVRVKLYPAVLLVHPPSHAVPHVITPSYEWTVADLRAQLIESYPQFDESTILASHVAVEKFLLDHAADPVVNTKPVVVIHSKAVSPVNPIPLSLRATQLKFAHAANVLLAPAHPSSSRPFILAFSPPSSANIEPVAAALVLSNPKESPTLRLSDAIRSTLLSLPVPFTFYSANQLCRSTSHARVLCLVIPHSQKMISSASADLESSMTEFLEATNQQDSRFALGYLPSPSSKPTVEIENDILAARKKIQDVLALDETLDSDSIEVQLMTLPASSPQLANIRKSLGEGAEGNEEAFLLDVFTSRGSKIRNSSIANLHNNILDEFISLDTLKPPCRETLDFFSNCVVPPEARRNWTPYIVTVLFGGFLTLLGYFLVQKKDEKQMEEELQEYEEELKEKKRNMAGKGYIESDNGENEIIWQE